jgi:predicted nucleotidyltransferase
LAEVPESAGVTADKKDKMAAFFTADTGREESVPAAPEADERSAGDGIRAEEQPVTAAIQPEESPVTATQAEEETMEKPAEMDVPAGGAEKALEPEPHKADTVEKEKPQTVAEDTAAVPELVPGSQPLDKERQPNIAETADMGHTTENHLVKGEKQMADAQEQKTVQQQAGAGSGGMVSYVALFVAIAALALVWFYASTSTGSPSVLSDLQKSKVVQAARIDAVEAKIDAVNAKLVESQKVKLQRTLAASVEALDTMAANTEGDKAEALKKMKADLQKMLADVK